MGTGEPLRGRTALVTGGSSGLGRASALALAAAGADVAVLARGSDELQQTAEQVRAFGVRAEAVVVDLADAEGIADAVERVRATLSGSTCSSTPQEPMHRARRPTTTSPPGTGCSR